MHSTPYSPYGAPYAGGYYPPYQPGMSSPYARPPEYPSHALYPDNRPEYYEEVHVPEYEYPPYFPPPVAHPLPGGAPGSRAEAAYYESMSRGAPRGRPMPDSYAPFPDTRYAPTHPYETHYAAPRMPMHPSQPYGAPRRARGPEPPYRPDFETRRWDAR
jgi:hypothetical protein